MMVYPNHVLVPLDVVTDLDASWDFGDAAVYVLDGTDDAVYVTFEDATPAVGVGFAVLPGQRRIIRRRLNGPGTVRLFCKADTNVEIELVRP